MLCAKCSKCCHTCDLGICKVCGTTTSSGSFSLCQKCAVANNTCASCKKPLDAKVDPLERRGGIVSLKNPSLLEEVSKQITDKFNGISLHKLKHGGTIAVQCNEPEADDIRKFPDVESVHLDW